MSVNVNEDDFFIKRLKDLANTAWNKNVYTFTDFLNMAQISLFYNSKKDICNEDFYKVYGGYNNSERAMIMFGNEDAFGYAPSFPISFIHIKPLNKKFADELNHRDFLGALINLGIKREVLGDIVVGDNEAFIVCLEEMAPFIERNLTRVKHTSVNCELIDNIPDVYVDKVTEMLINVASERLDAVLGEVFKLSRNAAKELIGAGKVYINSRQCVTGKGALKEGDIVSVRGYGRFVFEGVKSISRKGRCNAKVGVW